MHKGDGAAVEERDSAARKILNQRRGVDIVVEKGFLGGESTDERRGEDMLYAQGSATHLNADERWKSMESSVLNEKVLEK